ncbi:MAG: thymidylate synthase [Nanoarchaeota archaeon]
MTELIESDAKRLWQEALSYILENGDDYVDSDSRNCKEVFNFCLTIKDVADADVEQPVNIMISNKNWLYPSKEELSSIIFKKGSVPAYEYTYGGRIFNFSERLDQVTDHIIPLLKENPSSRRAVISVYDPLCDSAGKNHNVPSLMYMTFRLKKDRLFTTAHLRSSEVFFGWPANLFQLFKLHESISKQLAVESGDLSIFSNASHVFLDDLNHIRKILEQKE